MATNYKRLWARAYEQLAQQDELIAKYRAEQDEARAQASRLADRIAKAVEYCQRSYTSAENINSVVINILEGREPYDDGE